MEEAPNPVKGFIIVVLGTLIWWSIIVGLVITCTSCKPLHIVHDSEMYVEEINQEKQELKVKGRTITPAGWYWVILDLGRFEDVNEGDTLRVR